MQSDGNLGQSDGQLCQNCRYAVTYQPNGSLEDEQSYPLLMRGGEKCHTFGWNELLQAKDICRLCQENYATMSRRRNWDVREMPNIMAKKSVINANLHKLWFVRYSDTAVVMLLQMLVSTTSRNGNIFKILLFAKAAKHIRIESSSHPRALWMPQVQVSFAFRMLQLKILLRECRELHRDCISTNPVLPTRLLEINANWQGEYHVRLVESKILGPGPISYTALSHCWGSDRQGPTKTTTKNVHAHLKEIVWDNLTETFKDAVRVTSSLDIRYIWMDSLCIVQGDYEDWQREAAMMASVFRGSELLLAATGVGFNAGLFLDSVPPPDLVLTEKNSSSIFMVRWPPANSDEINYTPLNRRGWVFQELLLSRRRVHFSLNQFYWHCRCLMAAEDESIRWVSNHLTPGLLRFDDHTTLWQGLIQEYSEKEFTYWTDRLAAMAGICEWYRLETQQTPILGLWKESMNLDLAWVVTAENGSLPLKSTIPRLPSWSWLFWNSRVTFWSPKGSQKQPEFLDLHVLHCSLSWTGEPITSEVKLLNLRVRGLLKSIEIQHEIWEDQQLRLIVGGYSSEECHISVDEFGTHMLRASDAPRFLSAHCLLLSCRFDKVQEISFLILDYHSDVEGYPLYRRIGVGKLEVKQRLDPNLSWLFANVDPTELELV